MLLLAACSEAVLQNADEPPVVTLLRPTDGATFIPGEALEICAQVDDEKDVSQLVFTVQTDVDGVLFSGTPAECAGGNAGITITLSEGAHLLDVVAVDPGGQTGSDSASLSPEANSPPSCAFVAPGEGEAIEIGEAYTILAGATDADSVPSELSAVVASSLEADVLFDASPASGGDIEFLWTPTVGGEHGLTLTVTDPRGLTGDCTTSLYVNPCLDEDLDTVTTCEGDCDDEDPSSYPGATESADGADNDCNGTPDDGTELVDDDGDGFTEVDGDCDDLDAYTHPDALDSWYDGVDSNCDEADDFDQDGDGTDYTTDCDDEDPAVYPGATDAWYDGIDSDCVGNDDHDQDDDGAALADDCDDTDASVHPGAADVWYDGVDSDCDAADDYDQDADGSRVTDDCDDTDGSIHPAAADLWYDGIDADCDGADDYDQDADGETVATDCDDTDASYHSGAADAWYDGLDKNCDTADDYDQDADGFRAEAHGGTDCDDTDADVHPGADDPAYDGEDSDCSDDNDYDADGDGYLAETAGGSDCDDADATIHPGATDTWYDGEDTDCDDADDDDQDADGYAVSDDCDDLDPSINPGATEAWYDGEDTDCDGLSDYDQDQDGDDAVAWGGGDCDDTDPDVASTASELRDAADNDCDDECDEGLLLEGDLLITEIMKDPSKVSDENGEWFEVLNASGADIRLCGWQFYDLGTDSWTMPTELLIPAGAYAVFARVSSSSTNGGVTADATYGSSLALGNSDDELVIDDGYTELDRVVYDNGVAFPDDSGYSLTLDPGALDVDDNDDGNNWCNATSTFGNGDRGTPGSANDPC